MTIPALPPTIMNSRVINVTYHVVIEVDVPWGLDPTINLPITMGTIPFRPVYQQFAQFNPNAPLMCKCNTTTSDTDANYCKICADDFLTFTIFKTFTYIC